MPAKKSYLETGKQYHSLSLRDLLEARDAYHVFLMRKQNVIGTAISRYRVRKNGVSRTEPKTFKNTTITKSSWPCVMVFVDKWVKQEDFDKNRKYTKDDYVQKTLYLPDGREIPVCVIKAEWEQKSADNIAKKMKFPGSLIGGGYPIMTRVQGKERWATLGCLVSDGRITYGLTNAHVTGLPGESLFTMKNGNVVEIGASSQKQLRKVPFSQIYENFPGRHTMINIDIGLIELDDVNNVTSRIFGLGEVRGIEDVNHDTLSLKLIGCPVKGYGGASGEMKGEIVGLFYRYNASGGYDYVADYLVVPRNVKSGSAALPFAPTYGDSGTLLVIDDPNTDEDMKAIGVLWGGQQDVSGGDNQPLGLFTNLGTICQQFDIELVCDWNRGYDEYFGAYAHIVLPSLCASVIKDKNLKTLMENHINYISMPLGETAVKDTKGKSKADFVPLANVPDLVWKMYSKYYRAYEAANHFADMDQKDPGDKNKTLLDLCKDSANIDPKVWVKFYDKLAVKDRDMGALPFRIAQIFDAMVKAAKAGNKAKFVGEAGILTHYVFDACQPMHISYMHHGNPDRKELKKIGGKMKEVPIAYNVHDEFDTQMIEFYSEKIKECLPKLVKRKALVYKPNSIKTAREAAVEALGLMRQTIDKANPIEIVANFEELVRSTKADRFKILWERYGDGLMESIAEGVIFAARLWESAWLVGNGKRKIQNTSAVPADDLKRLYETKEGFLNSVKLKNIVQEMDWNTN